MGGNNMKEKKKKKKSKVKSVLRNIFGTRGNEAEQIKKWDSGF